MRIQIMKWLAGPVVRRVLCGGFGAALVMIGGLSAAESLQKAGTATAATVADTESAKSLSEQTLAFFMDGGPLMWVILLASVVGLTFTLERLFALRMKGHLQADLEERADWLLEHESADAALEYLAEKKFAQARALRAVLLHCSGSRKEMEESLEDELTRALWDERRNIRPVGMVATVAPLLGLLGTVQGMINAFHVAAETGMDNPALFAGGIYVALYTTAFGLIVAIPFLIVHNYLRGRAELILRRVEDQTLRYIARREFSPAESEAA